MANLNNVVQAINAAYNTRTNSKGYEYATIHDNAIYLQPKFRGQTWGFEFDPKKNAFVDYELTNGNLQRWVQPLLGSESDVFEIPADKFVEFATCHNTVMAIYLGIDETLTHLVNLINYALNGNDSTFFEMEKENSQGDLVGSLPQFTLEDWLKPQENHDDFKKLVYGNMKYFLNRDFTPSEITRLELFMDTHRWNMRNLKLQGNCVTCEVFGV